MYGEEAVPPSWLEPLELREVITAIADDLYAYKEWPVGDAGDDPGTAERVWVRYPGF